MENEVDSRESEDIARRGHLEAAEKRRREAGIKAGARYLMEHCELRVAATWLAEQGKVEAACGLMERAGDLSGAALVALKGGRHDLAATYYERAGNRLAAASAWERGNCPDKALSLYLELDETERIVALARHQVDKPELLRQAALHLEARGLLEIGAELLLRAGQPAQAGEWLVRSGRQEEGKALIREHGSLEDRAALLVEDGDVESAALVWIRAGVPLRAAELLAREGYALGAARLLRRLGRLERAAQVLEAVGTDSPKYVESTLLASAILEQLERHREALARLRSLVPRLERREQLEEVTLRIVEIELRLGDRDGATRTLAEAAERGLDRELARRQMAEMANITIDYVGVRPFDRLSREELATVTPPVTVVGFPQLERYEVRGRLSGGAHGLLFLVMDRQTQRLVVLKLMHSETLPTSLAREYFLREARALLRLHHPNIVQLLDVGEADGRPFYTMEYVRGIDLYEALCEQRWEFSPLEKVRLCIELCLALDHAHSQQVLHRDVKLENIMLTTDRRLKLLDFGLAKAMDENPHLSVLIRGTPGYMAPEQARGGFMDARTDLFSLGVVMYRLFTGERPFASVDHTGADAAAPDPRQHAPQLSPELAAVITRCLQPEPARRFSSVRELIAALEALTAPA